MFYTPTGLDNDTQLLIAAIARKAAKTSRADAHFPINGSELVPTIPLPGKTGISLYVFEPLLTR